MADAVKSTKNIVILGGSYAGMSVAHYTLKHTIPKLPKKESYNVILVSKSPEAMSRPACPRALISDDFFPQQKLFVNVRTQFEQYSSQMFRFIHGSVTSLDHAEKTVSLALAGGKTEQLHYHAVVIATGASTASPLMGLNQDADQLRASWKTFRASLESAKSIIIAGGGPTGVETAGELGDHLNGRAGWFSSKLENPKVAITVLNGSDRILPLIRPSLAQKAESYLAKVGVSVMSNTRVASVTPTGSDGKNVDPIASKTTVTLENGKILEADLYIPAFGTQPNTGFITDKSLLMPDGRVTTNASTLRVDKAGARVYAIGDASSYARPAVLIILEAVKVLSANLRRDLLLADGASETEAGADKLFKEDTRETHLVPIGKSYGVGSVMGWALPSFLVWLMKGRDYWLWTTGDLWNGKQWAKE